MFRPLEIFFVLRRSMLRGLVRGQDFLTCQVGFHEFHEYNCLSTALELVKKTRNRPCRNGAFSFYHVRIEWRCFVPRFPTLHRFLLLEWPSHKIEAEHGVFFYFFVFFEFHCNCPKTISMRVMVDHCL